MRGQRFVITEEHRRRALDVCERSIAAGIMPTGPLIAAELPDIPRHHILTIRDELEARDLIDVREVMGEEEMEGILKRREEERMKRGERLDSRARARLNSRPVRQMCDRVFYRNMPGY